jgi:hypothetical protein
MHAYTDKGKETQKFLHFFNFLGLHGNSFQTEYAVQLKWVTMRLFSQPNSTSDKECIYFIE